jgi:hypothetical protein
MPLKLVIAEPRADKINTWREEFVDVSTVEILQAPPSELARLSEVDAELLPSLVAVMRYDAPVSECSMVLSTGNEPDSPQWIVTTPQLPLNEGYELGDDGKLTHVRTRTVSDEQPVFAMFCEIFSAIDRFNESGCGKIETLGFGAESVCYRCDLVTHAAAIKRAYVEHLANGDCGVRNAE